MEEFAETDEEHRKRVAPLYQEKSEEDSLRKAGLLKECEPTVDDKQKRQLVNFLYEEVISVLKDYVVLEENQYKMVALWILGTYMHEKFNTFPLLFFNAMRGSGKSRTLMLISALASGGDGSVQNNLTEAVLFRIPRGKTTCIDEAEQISQKEKATLRELLNASYKKGMKVCRMRKTKRKNPETGQLEEVQIAEEFEPYFPIALANINGLDDVLEDRAITLILEKSDNPEKTKKVEDFTRNLKIQAIKHNLMQFCDVSDVTLHEKEWNSYLKHKYNITNITNNTNNTNNTNITQNPLIQKYLESVKEDINIDLEKEQFFDKLDSAGIVGRNFELFMPLLVLARSIDSMLFEDIFEVIKDFANEKKKSEYSESKDVLLYQFALDKEAEFGNEFIPIKYLTRAFRGFINEDDNEDRWLNEKWMGKALKRLKLILDKRHMRQGAEITINYMKAKEKLKIFKL